MVRVIAVVFCIQVAFWVLISNNIKPEKEIVCSPPEHIGDKTIAKLVDKEGVISLACEYHSTIKSTPSPNHE